MSKWIMTYQARKVGFKQSSPIQSGSDLVYYKVEPEKRRVLAINNSPPCVVSFDLTKRQFAKFQDGKLSLVTPGCCSLGRYETVEKCRKIHNGEINGVRHLRKILEAA